MEWRWMTDGKLAGSMFGNFLSNALVGLSLMT